MTPSEFDASSSSPRRGFSAAECAAASPSPSGGRGEATMLEKHSPPRRRIRGNGHYKGPPVELLSARVFRLRIARGYSVYDLAAAAQLYAGTIKRLESGKPVDKRDFPAVAAALGVTLCYLVCGEHDCAKRACVPPSRLRHGGSVR
jgi:hypothetical protein